MLSPEERQVVDLIRKKPFYIGLSERTRNLCFRHRLWTPKAIALNTRSELLKLRGMGEKSINELEVALAGVKLKLRQETKCPRCGK
jgi:DNA-directed RNA polymerase alpha subunit